MKAFPCTRVILLTPTINPCNKSRFNPKIVGKLIVFILVIALGACTDNRESIVRQFVSEQVNSQSNGILNIVSFKKTNGFKGDNSDSYVLEWEMVVKGNSEFWKIRLARDFFWGNFVTAPDQRTAEKVSMQWHNGLWISEQSPVHFPAGRQTKLIGNATMSDSEKGWIVRDIFVKSSLDLN